MLRRCLSVVTVQLFRYTVLLILTNDRYSLRWPLVFPQYESTTYLRIDEAHISDVELQAAIVAKRQSHGFGLIKGPPFSSFGW